MQNQNKDIIRRQLLDAIKLFATALEPILNKYGRTFDIEKLIEKLVDVLPFRDASKLIRELSPLEIDRVFPPKVPPSDNSETPPETVEELPPETAGMLT